MRIDSIHATAEVVLREHGRPQSVGPLAAEVSAKPDRTVTRGTLVSPGRTVGMSGEAMDAEMLAEIDRRIDAALDARMDGLTPALRALQESNEAIERALQALSRSNQAIAKVLAKR